MEWSLYYRIIYSCGNQCTWIQGQPQHAYAEWVLNPDLAKRRKCSWSQMHWRLLGLSEAEVTTSVSMPVLSLCLRVTALTLSAVNGAVKRKGRADHSAAFHQCPVITLIYNLSRGPSVPEESVSGPALAFNTTSITVQRTLSRSEPWWARGWERAEGLLENHEISRRTCKKFCFLVFIPLFLLFRSYRPFLFREVGTRREGYEGEKHVCSLWLCPLLAVCPGASCFPSLGFHPLICVLETGWALWCLSWLLRVQHGRDHLYQLGCFCS